MPPTRAKHSGVRDKNKHALSPAPRFGKCQVSNPTAFWALPPKRTHTLSRATVARACHQVVGCPRCLRRPFYIQGCLGSSVQLQARNIGWHSQAEGSEKTRINEKNKKENSMAQDCRGPMLASVLCLLRKALRA